LKKNAFDPKSSVAILNSLLGAELSAESTYRHVLEKAGNEKSTKEIRQIHQEHIEVRDLLSSKVVEFGGEPLREATTWKGITFLTELTSHPLSDPTAIKALREGEEQAVLTYEATLQNGEIDSELKELIEKRLLPIAKRHIPILERALAAA
jgi:rubrerythrin